MDPFATVQDVVDRWRPLSASEEYTVEVLLDDAADMIRTRWPDIDARIASGAISAGTVLRIVCAMVRRAMLNRNVEGVTQATETTGPFSQSASYANPTGNLYLNADDIRTLDGFGFLKRAKMGWLA